MDNTDISVLKNNICKTCTYWKYHQEEDQLISPPNHFTCLCELYKNQYICCKRGYSNLIKRIPYIGIYTPVPIYINNFCMKNSYNTIIENKTILDIVNFAHEVKLEVLNICAYFHKPHPYLNND